MPTQYVINSTDNNPMYSFFMPITCLMWKNYIGYEPVAILFGTENSWNNNPRDRFILDNIKKFAKIHYVNTTKLKQSTIVQISRIYASAIPDFVGGDYLLTSDVDMLPLNKEYFHQQDFHKAVHLFGADAYGLQKFAICYIGAIKQMWLEVMNININGLNEALDTYLMPHCDDWFYDESLFGQKIKRSPYFPGNCQLINRGWPEGRAARRLDRVAWNFNGEKNLIDCHCPRPGHQHPEILGLLKTYCNNEDFKWIENYFTTFNKII